MIAKDKKQAIIAEYGRTPRIYGSGDDGLRNRLKYSGLLSYGNGRIRVF